MAKYSSDIERFGIKSIINYLRKSRQDIEREKKTGEDTLHEQKLLMDRVLSAYGIPYEQKLEVGSGDKIATRPVFQSIINDIENDKYDSIAVKEISRMGRGSYKDMGTIYDLIIDKRLFIITPYKIYDPTNPADLRQIRFELFMSREEFETTRERLTGGRYNAAMEGKWVSGSPPFGYDLDSKTGKLVINEEEAEIVRTIFELYAYGIYTNTGSRKLVQFRALGTYLQRIGIKTFTGKEQWAANSLINILSNERYIGTLRYNEYRVLPDGKRERNPENEHVVVPNAHPAIIDMELWDRVQYRMNNRDTVTNTKLDFEHCELAGLCVCKKCGRKFIRRGSKRKYKKKDGTYSVYDQEFLFCGTIGCTYVKYRSIEEDILTTLEYLKALDTKQFEIAVSNLTVTEDNSEDTREDILKTINKRKEELKQRMAFIYEKYETKIYTDEMFLERKAEIDKELESLENIIIEDDPEEDNPQVINVDKTKDKIQSVLDAYETAESKTSKNAILHSVFDHVKIELLEKGRGARPAVHTIEPYLKSSFLTI